MNTVDLLEYRYLETTDDLETIGKLLFYTDPFIYPAFFGSADNAARVMKEAINRESYCFSPDNVFCAFYNDKPVAIICKNPDGAYKWEYKEWQELFDLAKIDIPNTFDDVAKYYFEPMNQERLKGYVYILAVCVSTEMRQKRVGTELLKRFLELHPCNKVLLDTLEENTAGIALYKKAGFTEQEHYWGYSLVKPHPCCVRMIKENN